MNRWSKRDDTIVHEEQPYNAEPTPAALADQGVTPVDVFYSRNHGPIPTVDSESWVLTVDGLVERQLSLSPADLRAEFTEHTVTATLACAGNRRAELISARPIPGQHPWGSGAASTAVWAGARMGDVLRAAGICAGAGHVEFTGADVAEESGAPYGSSVPLSKAVADEVLLAWSMNGEPLPIVHGAPIRVVVPGWIGARSVKWVRRITVRETPSDNHFQAVAYRLHTPAGDDEGIALGPALLTTAILSPAPGETAGGGSVRVAGYALAGDGRAVARVEVSADAGRSWVVAELAAPDGPWAWRLWQASVEVPPGGAQIVARAWDDTGATHPEHAASLWNPQGYANNCWARTATGP